MSSSASSCWCRSSGSGLTRPVPLQWLHGLLALMSPRSIAVGISPTPSHSSQSRLSPARMYSRIFASLSSSGSSFHSRLIFRDRDFGIEKPRAHCTGFFPLSAVCGRKRLYLSAPTSHDTSYISSRSRTRTDHFCRFCHRLHLLEILRKYLRNYYLPYFLLRRQE